MSWRKSLHALVEHKTGLVFGAFTVASGHICHDTLARQCAFSLGFATDPDGNRAGISVTCFNRGWLCARRPA